MKTRLWRVSTLVHNSFNKLLLVPNLCLLLVLTFHNLDKANANKMTDILGSIASAGQAASTGIGGFLGLLPSSAAATTCDASLAGACLQQYTTGDKVTYGVAIPDSASASTPYDMLVSITAPSTVGWAGVAMGGGSE